MFQGTGCRICGKLLPWQPLVLKKVKHSAGLFVGQVPGFQGSFILYEYIIVKHKQYLVVSIHMIHISTIYCSDYLQHIGQGILLEKIRVAAFSWILRFCTKLNANNKTSQVPSLWKTSENSTPHGRHSLHLRCPVLRRVKESIGSQILWEKKMGLSPKRRMFQLLQCHCADFSVATLKRFEDNVWRPPFKTVGIGPNGCLQK